MATDLITTDKDPLAGTTTRDTIERSVAEHRIADDIDRGGRTPPVEREDHPKPGPRSFRKQIRDAMRSVETADAKQIGADPNGMPAWLSNHPEAAKAWATTHHALRKVMVEKDEHIRNVAGFYQQRYGALDQVLNANRQSFAAHGLNDAQAVHTMFQWVGALSNPATARDAFRALAMHHNVNLSELGVDHASLIYENEQLKHALNGVAQAHQMRTEATAAREVAEWEKGKTLTREIKHTMARFLYTEPDRGRYLSLDDAYRMALTTLGIPAKQARERVAKQRAAVSPRGSTPTGNGRMAPRGGLRKSITDAMRATRGERL